jgi:hypothetical protein
MTYAIRALACLTIVATGVQGAPYAAETSHRGGEEGDQADQDQHG